MLFLVYNVDSFTALLGFSMTPTQYKNLSKLAKEYFKSLDLVAVKEEFISSFILNRNAKLEKGSGIPNYGLELTPSKFAQSDENLCGGEGKCLFTCLVFSGVDNVMKSKSMALSNTMKKRIRRTFLYMNDSSFFLMKLGMEIKMLESLHTQMAVRLNVFSDVSWEEKLDLEQFTNTIFYDYTKKSENLGKTKRHFTYSASEKDKDSDLVALLERGMNVAMVFGSKLPQEWQGFKVIDGDVHDRRYEDSRGVVVGLKQKTTQGGKTKSSFIK